MRGVRHCPKHAKETTRRGNEARPETDRVYKTARWQKTRAAKLRSNPLCERCDAQGRVTPAVLVDHILPVQDGGSMWDPDNHQSLCRPCHDAKTAEDLARRRSKG